MIRIAYSMPRIPALLIACLGLAAVGSPQFPPGEGGAGWARAEEPAVPEDSTLVRGEVFVPAALESFEGLTLQLQLWEYDPRAVDRPAALLDRVELHPAVHDRGRDSASPFQLGGRGDQGGIRPGFRYYVTCFLRAGERRTHVGEPEGREGLCRVLTEGHPREVRLILRPAP